jgi:hypothetical protein
MAAATDHRRRGPSGEEHRAAADVVIIVPRHQRTRGEVRRMDVWKCDRGPPRTTYRDAVEGMHLEVAWRSVRADRDESTPPTALWQPAQAEYRLVAVDPLIDAHHGVTAAEACGPDNRTIVAGDEFTRLSELGAAARRRYRKASCQGDHRTGREHCSHERYLSSQVTWLRATTLP